MKEFNLLTVIIIIIMAQLGIHAENEINIELEESFET